MKIIVRNILLPAFFGICAGFINGLAGTGGGIILVFYLSYLMNKKSGYTPRDVFATVILSIIPMSVVSAYLYVSQNSVDIADSIPYILPGLSGGIIGALLLDRISVKLLKKIFAVMVLYAGIKFVV